jgi:hemerythrin
MGTASAKIIWDKSLSTGHKATDLQHQILIDILNELIVALETDKAEEKFFTILDRLQHYAEWHFHREEKCMEEYHCPASEENKIAHMNFLRKVLEFRERSNKGITIELVRNLYDELSGWLVNHIKKIDCTLNECVDEYKFNNKPSA